MTESDTLVMNRTLDVSSAASVNALVFSGGEIWSEDEPGAQANANLQTLAQSMPGPSNAKTSGTSQSVADQHVSTYVRVFEDMVGTVIKEEKHLLNHEEFALLTIFAHLSYNARFLMVKLLLRKQETWHRLDSLKYERELGSTDAIAAAIDELCRVGSGPSDIIEEGVEEQQVIDLITINEDVVNLQQEQAKPASVDARSPEPSDNRPLVLARSEREMDLGGLLECLRVDELKNIAKQLKLKTSQRKDDLIKALLGASSAQSTLTSFANKDSSKSRGYHQSKLSFCKFKSQQDRLKEIVLRYIVRCVRVDEEFFGVIHRVNLVYFRLTQYTPGILVAELLTRFGKRAYPGYDYERTKNVWTTREGLLEYEEVLILEGQVDTLLAGNVPPWTGRALGSKTPVARSLLTPVTPGNANASREGEDTLDADKPAVKPDNGRIRCARMVKDILERIYPRWQNLVKTESEDGGRTGGLERFHHGHVLTRIVCKGSVALGTLGEYQQELEVLEALLAQKRWRRGQRGRWHERRALILSTHLQDDGNTERALDAVIDALKDPDTHLVFRPKLQRRLRKLENKLKIPVAERHTCDGILAEADEVVIEAVRLRHRAASLKLDRTGRNVHESQQGNQDIKRYYSPVTTSVKPEPSSSAVPPSRPKPTPNIPKGKSVWLGKNGEELTVEEFALQRYKERGFNGVHCETRVIAMLFSLLFWDIIFKSIPGAFETPYQTAPLDIAEDSFYHARRDLMEERLAAIEAGKGADLVRIVDAEHRASGTWCVGVQWDLFSSEDLVDIITCIGGKALSIICRVLCEDYRFGMSGGPDLFLWNTKTGTCKFVEVKGPGDTLQENQRIWIDILLRAPVAAEICRIVDSADEADKKPNMRTPKSTRKKAKKTPRKLEQMPVESEDEDALPCILDDPSMTLEERPITPGHVEPRSVASSSTIGPSAKVEDTSSPLKRKASPSGIMSPTPFKRQRT